MNASIYCACETFGQLYEGSIYCASAHFIYPVYYNKLRACAESQMEKICRLYQSMHIKSRMNMHDYASAKEFYWIQFTGNNYLHKTLVETGLNISVYKFHVIFERKIYQTAAELGCRVLHSNFRDIVLTEVQSKTDSDKFINMLSNRLFHKFKDIGIGDDWLAFFANNFSMGVGQTIEGSFCALKLAKLNHPNYLCWSVRAMHVRKLLQSISTEKNVDWNTVLRLVKISIREKKAFAELARKSNLTHEESQIICEYNYLMSMGNYLPPLPVPTQQELRTYTEFNSILSSSSYRKCFKILSTNQSLSSSTINLMTAQSIAAKGDAILLFDLKNAGMVNLTSIDKWISSGAGIQEIASLHRACSQKIAEQASLISKMIQKEFDCAYINFTFGDDLGFYLSHPKLCEAAYAMKMHQFAKLVDLYCTYTSIDSPEGFWMAISKVQQNLYRIKHESKLEMELVDGVVCECFDGSKAL
jgi:hypothetical protein